VPDLIVPHAVFARIALKGCGGNRENEGSSGYVHENKEREFSGVTGGRSANSAGRWAIDPKRC
jgi:hypothetical protein